MKILTRYVLRAHVGPFFFAFTTVTGLLFLNAVAQRMEEFAGKGLHWTVIGEFMVLSLPHIIALTFPMAVLVAVLYAFSDLTQSNEISAMAAGGVQPRRFMLPLLCVGAGLSAIMLGFNDRILPESNHRLSNLLTDVGSTTPTFELQDEVINPVHTGDDTRYFLRAGRIDQRTNELTDVTIFDLSTCGRYRTIQAARGTMYFSESGRDLILALEDGIVVEVGEDSPREFQRLRFGEQIVRMKGVGSELERRTDGNRRGDREMTLAMLSDRMKENRERVADTRSESLTRSREAVQRALDPGGLGDPDPDDLPEVDADGVADEGIVAEETGMPVDEEEALEGADVPGPPGGQGLPPEDQGPPPEGETTETAEADRTSVGLLPDNVTDFVHSTYEVNVTRTQVHQRSVYRYQVEYHKKWAIALACLVFVLLGPPLAIRFPRGGVGMVIAVSVLIFFLYWAGLIGGERLAERGHMHPIVAMWAPNVILLIPALILVAKMGREISPMRGGAWDNVRWKLKQAITRPFRNGRAAGPGRVPEVEPS